MFEKIFMISTIILAPVWLYIVIDSIFNNYLDQTPIAWAAPFVFIQFFMTFYFAFKYIRIPVVHSKISKSILILTVLSIVIEIICFYTTNSLSPNFSYEYSYYAEMRDLLVLVCGTGILGTMLYLEFNKPKKDDV